MAVKNPQFEINIRKNTNANNPGYGKYYPKAVEKQNAPQADERVHSEAIEEAIEFALGSLDKRESHVVNAYFGIGQEHETMAEIAEDMDLKRERVRQIRDKAIRKLRKAYKRRLKTNFR